jgi:hypothetical protein
MKTPEDLTTESENRALASKRAECPKSTEIEWEDADISETGSFLPDWTGTSESLRKESPESSLPPIRTEEKRLPEIRPSRTVLPAETNAVKSKGEDAENRRVGDLRA